MIGELGEAELGDGGEDVSGVVGEGDGGRTRGGGGGGGAAGGGEGEVWREAVEEAGEGVGGVGGGEEGVWVGRRSWRWRCGGAAVEVR